MIGQNGKIAVISDIHGNEAAFRAVLADIREREIAEIVCLGDVASLGPAPRECLELLRGLSHCTCLHGNHDRYVAFELFARADFVASWGESIAELERWCFSRIRTEDLELMGGWPTSFRTQAGPTSLFLVHASRDSDEDAIPRSAPASTFAKKLGGAGLIGYGHIHFQFLRKEQGVTYFNPGSVGAPFDGDRRAAYAVVDASRGKALVELIRVEYRWETTLELAAKRKMPSLATIEHVLSTASLPGPLT
jgi:putative phosphoesterase